MTIMLASPVLVLNRFFVPITVTSLKRAFIMLYGGVAKAVAGNYATFDFESWAQIAALKDDESIRTVSRVIKAPRVIMVLRYDKMPRNETKFNRLNIFRRDGGKCQYCGKNFPKSEFTIDHVIPRSRGGRSIWENVVCACSKCNRKKGGQTPEQARMKLINKPIKPSWDPFANFYIRAIRYEEWKPFLSFVDASYWNVELSE